MSDDADYTEAESWAAPQPRSFINPRGLSRAQQAEADAAREKQFSVMYPILASSGWAAPADYTDLPAVTVQRGGIQFPTQDEGDKMKTSEELISEAENLRQQAERLEEIAAQRAKYGEDPFKNGTILKIEMRYRTSNRTYTYVAIKMGQRYWLSGKVQPVAPTIETHRRSSTDHHAGWTWENLVAWLAQGDATVWRVKQLEQVL